MSERLSFSFGVAAAIVLSLCVIAFAERATAQAACPAGSSPATAADIPAMQAAGIVNPAVGMCWNSSDANTGATAGAAKQYLEQHATKSSNISCLNTQFSEQLQKMMQAIPSNLGTVLIDSAYRDPSTQAAIVASGASKVGACGSYHNYGLAADFNDSSKQVISWIRANASQYGLAVIGNATTGCFSSGFCDPAHVQESGSLPPSNQCGICSSSGVGTQSAPAVSTTGVANDNFLYTPPAGTQIPAGYCLASTEPLLYTPCGTALPQQTLPYAPQALAPYTAPISQPAAATAPITQPAAVPTATTPTSVVATSPTQTQTTASTISSVLGASTPLGTTLSTFTPTGALSNTTTSSALSSLLQTQPVSLSAFTIATSASSILQQFLNSSPITGEPDAATVSALGSAPSAQGTTSAQLASSTASTTIFTIIASTTLPSQSPTPSSAQPADQTTFESQGFTPTFSSAGSTPLGQLLGELRSALVSVLSYL